MSFEVFSHNGEVLPVEQAVAPLSRIEYAYGFGVYESVRVSGGLGYFVDEHCERLIKSAEIIGLGHNFSVDFVKASIKKLLDQVEADAFNLKILLIGGRSAEQATLDILCLNPHFPDRKLYRDGVSCITSEFERRFVGAKTLNMLRSYLAFRDAKAVGAYDALLVNRNGELTEGTRTNLFAVKDKILVTPPEADVLVGVTRAKVMEVAEKAGFEVQEKPLPLSELSSYDGIFLTATSIKILPINAIDNHRLPTIPDSTRELIKQFDQLLDNYRHVNLGD